MSTTHPELHALWDAFLAEWPPHRVRAMTLDQYTNLKRDDAFVYWLEKRTEKLGSIWGGTAFKWGVYRRQDTKKKLSDGQGMRANTDYGWYARYGDTPEAAFATVRTRLGQLIEAAAAGDLERVEALDVCWPVVKWKIAFLYQDREHPRIFPIYREDWLFEAYQRLVPTARARDTSRAILYPALLDRYSAQGDVFSVAEHLLELRQGGSATSRAWAIPLDTYYLDRDAALALCALDEVGPEDIEPLLDQHLAELGIRDGDRLALLIGQDVRAVGEVTLAEPGCFVWTQRAVELPSPLSAAPARVEELDAADRDTIWGAIQDPTPTGVTQYWKIAPEKGARLWEDWKKDGFVAIGWPDFGDVRKLDRAGFERRMKELIGKRGYGTEGPRQVWRFRNIPVGSRVVVNRGTSSVLGVGTVVGPYQYHPEAGEYCHWLPVRWDSLSERSVDQPGWRKTLIQLDEETFSRVTDGKEDDKVKSASHTPGRCPEPESVILHGPPGTGKTYSVTERALRILLGPAGVPEADETRATQFRELQRKGRIEMVTFHPSYGYEEFVEGLRPMLDKAANGEVKYAMHRGAFTRIALRAAAEGLRLSGATTAEQLYEQVQQALDQPERSTVKFAFTDKTPPYVLIIDEINRGNISRILGELITLLEPDKRLGMDNELKLPLASSPERRFAVPPNLHIIGTMNTADRSIALLDVAIRRRFRFEEMPPDAEVLRRRLADKKVSDALVQLVVDLFETINARVRFLLDPEHQLGHAYFLKVRSLDDLRRLFADQVIPLLQEYFYGAWDRVTMVLGCPVDEDGLPRREGPCVVGKGKDRRYRAPLIEVRRVEASGALGFEDDALEGRLDFAVAPAFRAGARGAQIPDADLAAALLGVLALDAQADRDRLAALAPPAAPAAPEPAAGEPA